MDQGKNKSVSIRSRVEDAKLRRDINQIEKNQRQLERKYRILERKNTSSQREIVSLLGNDVYLDSGIKDSTALFGQNIPGFCYRRNGQPRRPSTLYESKTTRVIHTLDGREGFIAEQAANVVSDNPLLDEILSTPDVLQILCDLRTTALLGRNKKLLFQFIQDIRHSSAGTASSSFNTIKSKFPTNEDPIVSLEKYRATLIQELFDKLRIQAELRVNSTLSTKDRNGNGKNEVFTSLGVNPGLRMSSLSKSWNEALVRKLNKLAMEKEEDNAEENEIHKSGTTVDEVDYRMLPSAPTLDSSSLDYGSPFTQIPAEGISFLSLMDLPPMTPITKPASPVEQQEKFDHLIRSLITEVGNVVGLQKMVREFHRKNPSRASCSTGVLSKLLKRDTFNSIDDKASDPLRVDPELDLLSKSGKTTYFNSTTGSSRRVLNLYSRPRDTLSLELKEDQPKFYVKPPASKISTKTLMIAQASLKKHAQKFSGLQNLKTRHRLCCTACKAKLRQACDTFKERDNKYQKQIEESDKVPTRSIMKELENLSEKVGYQPRGSIKNRIVDTQSMKFSDGVSAGKFSLESFSSFMDPILSTHPSPVKVPSVSLHVKFLPDLVTPVSYAPSSVRNFTVPVPSPGNNNQPFSQTSNERIQARRRRSTDLSTNSQPISWTLKVSRLDLFKLRHELQRTMLKERMVKLTKHLSMQNAQSRRNVPITPIKFNED